MKKINLMREWRFIVKKTKNKKNFIIFFQQGYNSEKKCIFASLLKYSVWKRVMKQTRPCKSLFIRRLAYSLKPWKFIRLDDENVKIDSQNFQKWLKTKNYSNMRKLGRYLRETYDELVNKVTWPSADDLQSSVVVVSIASLIIALIVWLMDVFFSWFMGLPFMFPPLS